MEKYDYDIIPGLRIIFENKNYLIKPEHASGFAYRKGDSSESSLFTIVNTICTPEEVSSLFKSEAIVQRIQNLSQYKGAVYFYKDVSGFVNN